MSIEYNVAIAAVENDDLELLMLNIHIDNNTLNLVGNPGDNTLLHMAVRNNRMKSVKWLVEKGRVNLEPVNSSGETPLMVARNNRNYSMVSYLGTIGLDLNSYDQKGLTMIHQCLLNGDARGMLKLSKMPGVIPDKPSRNGTPTSYYLLSSSNLSSDQKNDLIEKLMITDFDFQLDQPISGRKFRLLEMLGSVLSYSGSTKNMTEILKKSKKEWLLNRDHHGRNLLMQWYLGGRDLVSTVGNAMLETELFDLTDNDDDGVNLIQLVILRRVSMLYDLLRMILQKDHSLIDENTFIVALRTYEQRICTLMHQNNFDFSRVIKGNPEIGCCNLLHWSITKDYPIITENILKNGKLSASDLITQICPGVTKRDRIRVSSGCSCGECRRPSYKTVERHIPGCQPALWLIYDRVDNDENWSRLLELALDILVNTGIDRENLVIPKEHSMLLKNGNIKPKLNFFVQRNLLNTNLITRGDPHNIYAFQQKDQKKICLEDKLNINTIELISNQPIEQIPAEHFILLSNGIAWDVRNLFEYIQKNENNLYHEEASHISQVFQGLIWSDFDLEKFKSYQNAPDLSKKSTSSEMIFEDSTSEEMEEASSDDEEEASSDEEEAIREKILPVSNDTVEKVVSDFFRKKRSNSF